MFASIWPISQLLSYLYKVLMDLHLATVWYTYCVWSAGNVTLSTINNSLKQSTTRQQNAQNQLVTTPKNNRLTRHSFFAVTSWPMTSWPAHIDVTFSDHRYHGADRISKSWTWTWLVTRPYYANETGEWVHRVRGPPGKMHIVRIRNRHQ